MHARIHDVMIRYVYVAYFRAIYKLRKLYLAGTVFFDTVPGKGWPAGQYVYVVNSYTYASLYTSSYLYKMLLEYLTSYM